MRAITRTTVVAELAPGPDQIAPAIGDQRGAAVRRAVRHCIRSPVL